MPFDFNKLNSNINQIASGTQGNWYYRKWSNGFAECWKNDSLPARTYVARGGFNNFQENYPSELGPFADVVGFVTASLNGWINAAVGYTGWGTGSFEFYVVNQGQDAATNIGGMYHVYIAGLLAV